MPIRQLRFQRVLGCSWMFIHLSLVGQQFGKSKMALLQTPILLLLLVLVHQLFHCKIAFGIVSQEEKGEEFTEELLLKPLPDRKVLAHFHFSSKAPPSSTNGRHHHLFPKAISQLVEKFRIKELELSFTQGRWSYESWGGFDTISSSNAKPPGVELWALFDAPEYQIDASWKNLTHTLSGLFCASINFLESSTTYADPQWSFPPTPGKVRYGNLPREAVCTENLTPWLKLLPCRDKDGISSLMDRPSIYRSFYHSQRLHITALGTTSVGSVTGIVLEQTLTIALQPHHQRYSTAQGTESMQPSWSISSIFGRKIGGRCVLARSSNVYLLLDGGLVKEVIHQENETTGDKSVVPNYFWSNPCFGLSAEPDMVYKEVAYMHGKSSSILYRFSIEDGNSKPFDLGLTWKIPVVWSCQQAPFHASRFLMGSGNERGAIAISFKSTKLADGFQGLDVADVQCKVQVDVFQVVPWYIKIYFHSLQVFVDQQPKAFADVVEKINVSPSKDKLSPGVMEMVLKLPCSVKSAALTIEFDKGFLHIDEYPPDANQGFDIPSAVVTFPNFDSSIHFLEVNDISELPMLSKLQERNPIMMYTEVLLVPLTTPDFSMPYNVITITCTVFALYFGSLLNVLRRRAAEEEKMLREKAARKSGPIQLLVSKFSAKLRGRPWEEPHKPETSSSFLSSKLILRIILVAGIAVAWQYLS